MNRPFITLLLCILPFPVTFAEEVALDSHAKIALTHCAEVAIEQINGKSREFCITLNTPKNAPKQ